MRAPVLLSLLAAALLLAACGGASDDASNDAPPSEPDAAQSPAAEPVGAQPPTSPTSEAATEARPARENASADLADLFILEATNDRLRAKNRINLFLRVSDPVAAAPLFADADNLPQAVLLSTTGYDPVRARFGPGGFSDGPFWNTSVFLPVPGEWHTTIVLAGGREIPGPTLTVEEAVNLLQPFGTAPVPAFLHRIAVFNADGSSARFLWNAEPTSVAWIANPDRVVFVQRHQGALWVVAGDPTTGVVTPLLPLDQTDVSSFSRSFLPSPDGRYLAVKEGSFALRDDRLRILDTLTGSAVDVPLPDGTSRNLSWAPDANALLVLDSRIRLIEPDGAVHLTQPLPASAFYAITWAPDGSVAWLVPQGVGATEMIRVDIERRDITAVPGFRRTPNVYWPPEAAISPDGERLAFAWPDEATGAWHLAVLPLDPAPDLRSVEPAFTLPLDSTSGASQFTRIGGLSWSPSGSQLTFSVLEEDSSLWLLDLGTGQVRELHRLDRGLFMTPPAWSADGSQLSAVQWSCFACEGGALASMTFNARSGALIAYEPFARLLTDTASGQLTDFFLRPGELLLHLTDPITVLQEEGMTYRIAVAPSSGLVAATVSQGLSGDEVMRYSVRPDGTEHQVVGLEPAPRDDESRPTAPPSPDGSLIAKSGRDGVWVDTPDGQRRTLSEVGAERGSLIWAPDGSAVAYESIDPNVQGIVVAYADGRGAYLLVRGYVELRDWTADGRIEYTVFSAGA